MLCKVHPCGAGNCAVEHVQAKQGVYFEGAVYGVHFSNYGGVCGLIHFGPRFGYRTALIRGCLLALLCGNVYNKESDASAVEASSTGYVTECRDVTLSAAASTFFLGVHGVCVVDCLTNVAVFPLLSTALTNFNISP
jgi:hypothetical protein